MKNKCENCGKCCLETEMIVSNKDIENIVAFSGISVKKEDFVFINDDGFYQLKNYDGHCLFLDASSRLCKIYKYRPQGCRFYPLIYNYDEKKCVFDEDCPRPRFFYQNPQEFKRTCKYIKRFLTEELKLNLLNI